MIMFLNVFNKIPFKYLNNYFIKDTTYCLKKGSPWPSGWNVCFNARSHKFDSWVAKPSVWNKPVINY